VFAGNKKGSKQIKKSLIPFTDLSRNNYRLILANNSENTFEKFKTESQLE